MPFRCPLRWVLVSGKQKGQSEAQLVIKRDGGISPASDAGSTGTTVKHVFLVYAGNKPQPEVTLCLDPETAVQNGSAVVFRYYITRKRLLFDCPGGYERPDSMVDLYFTDSADLEKTVGIINNLGIKSRNCDHTLPSVARSQSSAGYMQRPMPNIGLSHGSISPGPMLANQAFSTPLMIRSKEGCVTPVQLQRVGRRKRIPTPSLSGRCALPGAPRSESYRGATIHRPCSVPAGLQASKSSFNLPISLCSPTIDTQTARDWHMSPGSSAGCDRQGCPLIHPVGPRSRQGPNTFDEFPGSQDSSQLDALLFEEDMSIETGYSQGVSANPCLESTRRTSGFTTPLNKGAPTAPQLNPATRTYHYQDAQVQVEEDAPPRTIASDMYTIRMFGMLDIWEDMRRTLWKKVDLARLDDEALDALVSNYQNELERSLSNLPSVG